MYNQIGKIEKYIISDTPEKDFTPGFRNLLVISGAIAGIIISQLSNYNKSNLNSNLMGKESSRIERIVDKDLALNQDITLQTIFDSS